MANDQLIGEPKEVASRNTLALQTHASEAAKLKVNQLYVHIAMLEAIAKDKDEDPYPTMSPAVKQQSRGWPVQETVDLEVPKLHLFQVLAIA
jgi:hypothetical protein